MENKSIRKRIENYFEKRKTRIRIMLSLVEGVYRKDVVKPKKFIPPEPVNYEADPKIESEIDFVIYDQRTIDLKLAAIDKIFAMQDSFSRMEFCWLKLIIGDPVFVKIYFEGTNAELVDYLESKYKEGKFTTKMMNVMTELGMVVMSFADRMRFVDVEDIIETFGNSDISNGIQKSKKINNS